MHTICSELRVTHNTRSLPKLYKYSPPYIFRKHKMRRRVLAHYRAEAAQPPGLRKFTLVSVSLRMKTISLCCPQASPNWNPMENVAVPSSNSSSSSWQVSHLLRQRGIHSSSSSTRALTNSSCTGLAPRAASFHPLNCCLLGSSTFDFSGTFRTE